MDNIQNTVNLSLEDYNHLRDFKTNIENGNTYRVSPYVYQNDRGWFTSPVNYVSTDLAVKEIAEENDRIAKYAKELEKEIEGLKCPKKKQYTVDDIKKMPFLKLIIWKIKK